jgi:hypothetical protein
MKKMRIIRQEVPYYFFFLIAAFRIVLIASSPGNSFRNGLAKHTFTSSVQPLTFDSGGFGLGAWDHSDKNLTAVNLFRIKLRFFFSDAGSYQRANQSTCDAPCSGACQSCD